MTAKKRRIGGALLTLIICAIGGALFAFLSAGYLWAVQHLLEFLWGGTLESLTMPKGDIIKTFIICLTGGLLVGLCQKYVGNYPYSINAVISSFKTGERISLRKGLISSGAALLSIGGGAPLGIESGLGSTVGGVIGWFEGKLQAVRRFVLQIEHDDLLPEIPRYWRHLPYWLAGIVSVLVFQHLPFGFTSEQKFATPELSVMALLVTAIAALVMFIPAQKLVTLTGQAQQSTYYKKRPIVMAMFGGFVLALLAVVSPQVLSAGQYSIGVLTTAPVWLLIYIAIAKPLAILTVFWCGWRGGNIFPLWFTAAAMALALSGLLGMSALGNAAVMGAITALCVVTFKNNVAAGALLALLASSLLSIPFVIAAAVALYIARMIKDHFIKPTQSSQSKA